MLQVDVVDTWTVQILSDSGDLDDLIRLRANLPAYMEELEENLTDRLPKGYRAIVKEWSDERSSDEDDNGSVRGDL